ncbi:MAG TPA: tripartite tricarboxylate transporter substrate binding protein BugD [Pseudolabrys sp.]|nr:tripartite tricarboxylate transporter substrate binding protein BugD [Pseudolabrys sp.]
MTCLRAVLAAILTTLATIVAGAVGAAADTYPSRTITIIVPFAAGGPSDAMARILAERMKAPLGQQIVVENVTGAGGSIGVGRAVAAAPDGYTISFGHLGTHVCNGAIYPLNYDLLKDLEPVVMLPSNPMVVVSKKAVPATNLKDFVAWVKANDGKVTAGTAGAGSGSHIAGVYFQNLTGAKLQYVPYRGTGPALNDLVAGQIDMIIDQTSNSINQIRTGNIRAYAVTDVKRVASASDIPTADEAGLKGFHMTLWSGMWVPKGTPKAAIAKLNAAVVETLADPAVRKRMEQLGLEIPPREQQTPEALGKFHKAEIDKWWPIIKAANISAK